MFLCFQRAPCLLQCGVKGVNRPYDPNYADEDYSYEYGGYVDPKRQGSGLFGGRGRGGRPPRRSGGRCVCFVFECSVMEC